MAEDINPDWTAFHTRAQSVCQAPQISARKQVQLLSNIECATHDRRMQIGDLGGERTIEGLDSLALGGEPRSFAVVESVGAP